MTLILSGTDGLSDIDGTASTPAIRGTDANTGIFFPAADTIAFAEGGVEAMRIDSSGYILGGYSSAFDMSPAGTGQYAGISASTSLPSDWKFGALSFSADSTANGMLFVKSRSATVGTNTVVQSGDALGNIVWRGADGTNYINAASIQAFVDGTPGTNDMPGRLIFATTADGAASQTERMRIDSSGNVLVGTTGPVVTERFSVSNSGTYVAAFNQSTNTSGYHVLRLGLNPNGNNTSSYFLHGNTNTVGNWFLYGNGTTSFSSDARLKKNIETTRDGYLEDVAKLRVVKYNWRNDEEGKLRELGLIAQEVEQVFPGLVQDDSEKVSEDDETRYKSLKQSVLPFILLKAIQELKAINDAQAQTIESLTTRIAALEAKG